jgi:hypothetical protein
VEEGLVDQSDDPSHKVKVVDRRRFTDSGELRDDWKPQHSPPVESADVPEDRRRIEEPRARPPAAPEKSAPGPRPAGAKAEHDAGSATSPLFLELVEALAQQAVLLLEGAEGLEARPEEARRVIDYLGVLELKTRGNLSAEESQSLSTVVFQLRSLYLQRRK